MKSLEQLALRYFSYLEILQKGSDLKLSNLPEKKSTTKDHFNLQLPSKKNNPWHLLTNKLSNCNLNHHPSSSHHPSQCPVHNLHSSTTIFRSLSGQPPPRKSWRTNGALGLRPLHLDVGGRLPQKTPVRKVEKKHNSIIGNKYSELIPKQNIYIYQACLLVPVVL